MIGTKLAHFEVTAKLGEGGMGEVWRATDTKLGREVAIKVLPEVVADDPERLARFEREAQVLASLNHQNIAAIHEVGESVGEPARHFLVMELVEGPTLAERLEQGAMPVDEALPVALQIAEALEAAHERGVIHRDLKPQNIKLTSEGRVKVLDFGLAKAISPDEAASGSSPHLTHSPTMTLGATVEGVILGTAAYMAPEQAKGQAADKRADIWAFGVVLKEMLTGARLFDAPTAPETLAKVLTATPDVAQLPAATPPALRRLLERCLVREPRERLRDIGDARLELEAARREAQEGGVSLDVEPVGGRRWREVVAWAVAAAIAVGAMIVGLRPRTVPQQESRALHFEVTLPEEHRIAYLDEPTLALSSDGTMVAFVALVPDSTEQMLFVRSLADLEARPVSGTEGATSPAFSPDGRELAFFADEELRRIPVEGGRATRIADVANPRGVVWASDGALIYSPDYTSGLWRVRSGSGAPELLAGTREGRAERTYRWPDVSPDGRVAFFTIGFSQSPNDYQDAEIAAVRVDTGEVRVLLERATTPRFVPPDRLFFARGSRLYSVTVHLEDLTTEGDPVPVVDGVGGDPSSGVAYFAVAANGDLSFIPGSFEGTRTRLVLVDFEGDVLRPETPGLLAHNPRFSPDGSTVAFTMGAQASNTGDIWTYSLEDGSINRVTFSEGDDTAPIYTPDGKWIVFQRATDGIMRQPADGSGAAEKLTPEDRAGQIHLPNSFSPDGRILAFTDVGPSTDVYLMRLGEEPVLFEVDASGPAISPDGRWIAFNSPSSGSQSVVVRPLEGEGRWQVSPGQGGYPWWAKDGREIYYLDIEQPSRPLMRVPVFEGSNFRFGRPELVLGDVGFRFVTSTAPDTNWHITPSADRAIFVELERDDAVRDRIEMKLGWMPRGED